MNTEADVRTSLKDFPDTLTTAYDIIYQPILDQKKSSPKLALNAFRWVKFSYEPLASKFFLDAVGVEVSQSREYSQVPLDSNTVDRLPKPAYLRRIPGHIPVCTSQWRNI
jgi:hypothetical protein